MMRIARLETYTRDHLSLVRVVADDGREGWGQMRAFWLCGDVPALVFRHKIAPLALGADALDIEGLETRLLDANYRDMGPYLCKALAGLDTALWDLRGKVEGKSVCEMLATQTPEVSKASGVPRKRLPVYAASLQRQNTSAQEAGRLQRLCDEQGFRAVKIRIGQTNGHDQDSLPGRTAALVPAVRKALGDDIHMFVDANSCYTPKKAIEIGHMLQDNGVGVYEEPCPYWELEWTAEVAAALDVSVAGGEQDIWLSQWRRMIEMRAVDIVQPDIGDIGGLTQTLRVARMAAAAGLPCMPHSSDRSLTLIYTLHLMAAIPNAAPFVEYLIEDTPWSDRLFVPEPVVCDGALTVPDGPGWGVHINAEWLAAASREIYTSDKGTTHA